MVDEGRSDWLSEMSTEELRRKLWMDGGQEEGEIRDVMLEEMNARFETNPFVDEAATFADVLTGLTEEDMLRVIDDNFTHLRHLKVGYMDLLNQLRTMEADPGTGVTIEMRAGRNALSGHGADWIAFGSEPGEEEPVELTYCPWAEWLGFRVVPKQLRLLGIPLYATACLANMTKAGMTEAEIQAEFDSIQQEMANMEAEGFGEEGEEE